MGFVPLQSNLSPVEKADHHDHQKQRNDEQPHHQMSAAGTCGTEKKAVLFGELKQQKIK